MKNQTFKLGDKVYFPTTDKAVYEVTKVADFEMEISTESSVFYVPNNGRNVHGKPSHFPRHA